MEGKEKGPEGSGPCGCGGRVTGGRVVARPAVRAGFRLRLGSSQVDGRIGADGDREGRVGA